MKEEEAIEWKCQISLARFWELFPLHRHERRDEMRKLQIPNWKLILVLLWFGSLLFVFPTNTLPQSETGYTVIPV
jgi:hypothetical protein